MRTQAVIAAEIKTKSEEMQGLVDTGKARETKTCTTDEMKRIEDLDGELTTLETELEGVQKQDGIKAKNDARLKKFNTPVNPMIHQGGNGGDDSIKTDGPVIEFGSVGSLKHINVGTRQQSETKAYRFAQYFFATMAPTNPTNGMFQKSLQYCNDNGISLKAAMNEGINEQGGVLVPAEFDSMLIRLIETYGVFRQYTKISPMGNDTKSQPRRTGGVTAYWVGEGKAITQSTPNYDNVSLVAKKLAALVAMSSELSEDSAINIADDLAFEIGYAFALSEDQAGFIGDASSTYGGITGVTQKLKGLNGTIANIAGLFVGAGNLFSELLLSDFNNTLALLPQYADTPLAAWFCHKSFYHGVMQARELAAGGVTASEISNGDRRPRPLFLGYPVNFVQVMPRVDANSQVCALLGDLSLASTMGDRRKRTLFTDPYSLAANDQIRVRGTERVDINVHDVGNWSATAADRVPGPVVGLISAAS